ncbi:MAG: PQQ-binding-like beta-propeller repeat protein [Planctomycetota bacterium]|nr:PQQ-binding-like beta-propeller repeat protein [Planctomycetota bacterium]
MFETRMKYLALASFTVFSMGACGEVPNAAGEAQPASNETPVASTNTKAAPSGDWPMWGHSTSRNMYNPNSGSLTIDFYPGDFIGASDEIDPETSTNVKWIAKLGSQSYGNATIADGRVYVGTNNDAPRFDKYKGDRCVLNCFDEETGELIWQINFPKLGTGKVSDWEFLGICSSPAVEGDRVYFVSNLCQVICADVNGMADGNDGPFQDEAMLFGAKIKVGPPVELGPKDGDIIWTLNMIDECGVFPHNITSSAVLVADDKLWVTTSNGVDYGHVETPAPFAPCLIQVDKKTGKLLGEESSGLSERIFHCNWTSPTWFETDDSKLGIFGGPDGWVYGFRPDPKENEEGYAILDEAFRFDANPAIYRERDGKPVRYVTVAGPSEVIATPVVYKNRVYVPIGQDPEHGEGAGNLVCIDPTKTGNSTESGMVWQFDQINRSVSTPSIVDDLVYVADYSGFVYCLDADTGELYWKHDTMSHIWGSTLVADGKVFIGNEDGYLTILKTGKEKELLGEIDMMSPIYSSPVAANGVLYVQTHTHLFAIKETP